MSKVTLTTVILALAIIFNSNAVLAASQVITANVTFVAKPTKIINTAKPSFSVSKKFIKNGVVATKNGTFRISGANNQSMDIVVENYVAAKGFQPLNARCAYNGSRKAACSLANQEAPGFDGKEFVLNMDVAKALVSSDEEAEAPYIDVVFNYQ